MKVTHRTVENIIIKFDRNESVVISKKRVCSLSGGYVQFILDCESWTLSIEGDWGNFAYRWYATPSVETFKELLCRLSKGYLLDKISQRTEIDWKKTKRNAIKAFFSYGKNRDKDTVKEFLGDIDNFVGSEDCFYRFLDEYIENVWDCGIFEKEHPMGAQVTAELFMKYLIPELKKEGDYGKENKT